MEFKSIAVADISTSERKLIGYAAAFNNVDTKFDIIKPGAFAKTIAEQGDKVKTMYNHKAIIGRPTIIREDKRGLYTESIISKTPTGDEVLQLIADGLLTEMSIGYKAINYQRDPKTGIRTLNEVKLSEFGPVDFGCNERATITGFKALADYLGEQHPLNPQYLAELRREIKSLLDALESATGEPAKATPDAGPSLIDTRILKLSEEHTARLAAAFRTKP